MDRSRWSSFWIPLAVLIWFGVWFLIFALTPSAQPLFTTVFASFFRRLGELALNVPDGFWLGSLFGLGYLAICGAIGLIFIRLFVRLPLALELALVPFLGAGLVNFVMEFPAIFFQLHQTAVSLVLAGFLIAAIIARRWLGWSAFRPSFDAEPMTPVQRGWHAAAWTVLGLISLFTFYHSVLYPVDYWDSLILYVNYARMTWLHEGFPRLACLQVGLGLGANYPHLFSLQQSATAALFGHWSDLYAQWTAPLAGLASIVTMYFLFLYLYRNRLAAVLGALCFRGVTFVTSYYVYASDYALVMLFTCAFLLFLALFLDAPARRSAQPLLLVAAIFPHINYLGWIVWPCVAAAFIWTIWKRRDGRLFIALLDSSALWFALAMTWYVRNWWFTGNPVYAFFPEWFGGVNVNLEVLASANQEWTAHGNGFARLGDNAFERVINSLPVFLFDWRMAPLTGGLMLPAMLLGWRRARPFEWIVLMLVLLYALYQYVISGLYIYHTIAAFILLSVFAARLLAGATPRLLACYAALIVAAGVAPGLSFAIMGPKVSIPTLPIFAMPGISTEAYYSVRYPAMAPAWRYINEELPPFSVVLTHDNRYHVYRDDIGILHLDDCNLTNWYDRPYDEVHRELLDQGVGYYLQIHGEATHPITARLGHLNYLDDPRYFELLLNIDRGAEYSRLYRLVDLNEAKPSIQ